LAVHWSIDGDQGVPDPRLPALGRRWIGSPDGTASGWREHRLALGVAEGIDELGSDKNLWLECNADLLNGVSFTKGCYVGQENTARMNWRNKVNRRLVVTLGGTVERRGIDRLGDALVPAWLAEALVVEG
ncbi:MAG: folate-binding protein, partial [Rhizorhabdus sp.]|nr:folate-binding protein [Rhizorhabdus sp.]